MTPGKFPKVATRAGDGGEIAFRRGTSDLGLIYDILLKPGDKGENWLPPALQPRTILDIGGNIGVASCYLAHHVPSARVIAGAKWIYGELHSDAIAAAAALRTLDYLSHWFDIETAKSVCKRNYFSDACRWDLGIEFRDFRRYR